MDNNKKINKARQKLKYWTNRVSELEERIRNPVIPTQEELIKKAKTKLGDAETWVMYYTQLVSVTVDNPDVSYKEYWQHQAKLKYWTKRTVELQQRLDEVSAKKE